MLHARRSFMGSGTIPASMVTTRRVGRFAAKERDAETGLDYFGARYLSSAQGRFTSADPTFMTKARIGDPQQWNLYAYTRNNPMKYLDPDGRDLVLAGSMNRNDRNYVVQNLARLYSTPAGRAMIQHADQSSFTIAVGTGHLPRTDLSNAAPGVTVYGGQTRVDAGNTSYGSVTAGGHKILVAQGPDSPTAPAIKVTVDPSQSSEIGKDPATVLAHEIGGHTAEVINAASGNPSQFIDNVNPRDEASSVAAEKAVGKLPGKANPEDVRAIQKILEKRRPEEQ